MIISIMKINKRIKSFIWAVLSIVFWILVWGAISKNVNSDLVLPSPKNTLLTLIGLMKTTLFWKICLSSVTRIFAGALFGILAGTILAILSHFFLPVKYLTSPLTTVVKATPVASFIILFLILIGKEHVPFLTSAMISMPIIFSNVFEGFETIDKNLAEVCTVYKFSFSKKCKVLYLPSIKPYFLSGIKSCIGLAWKAGIAAEVLCTPDSSIGLKIHETRVYLETPSLFAWTGAVIIFSLIFEKVAVKLIVKERRTK